MRVDRPAARTIAGIMNALCYRIARMSEAELHIRCMRCGAQMEMRDPAPDRPWTPDQFWVCPRCGRHFWTTYPPPNREKPKAAEAPKPADSSS
jgi:DNA-directed RNA polymerase subunit RPC12/RpoP